MIGVLLRILLPTHLDWMAPLADAVLELVDDVATATRRGWTDDDDHALANDIAAIVRRIQIADDALRDDIAIGMRAAVLIAANVVRERPNVRHRQRWKTA